jgi:hypothetical protein
VQADIFGRTRLGQGGLTAKGGTTHRFTPRTGCSTRSVGMGAGPGPEMPVPDRSAVSGRLEQTGLKPVLTRIEAVSGP